jgi:hypothetical protein
MIVREATELKVPLQNIREWDLQKEAGGGAGEEDSQGLSGCGIRLLPTSLIEEPKVAATIFNSLHCTQGQCFLERYSAVHLRRHLYAHWPYPPLSNSMSVCNSNLNAVNASLGLEGRQRREEGDTLRRTKYT